MNRKSIVPMLTALCVALSGPVFAQKAGDDPMSSFGRSGGNPHPPSVRQVGDGQNTPSDAAQNGTRRDARQGAAGDRRGPGYRAGPQYRGDAQHRGGPGYSGDARHRGGPGYSGPAYRGGPGYRGGDRGAGPNHSFYRGQRLPPQYRSHQYVVDDWRGHHLNAPPRGYHWVQTGGDYVLVAIATGIIAALLLNN